MSNLRYEDDTFLCAQSNQEASYLIKMKMKFLLGFLELNVKKTETFCKGNNDDYHPIKIDDKEIKRVKLFRERSNISCFGCLRALPSYTLSHLTPPVSLHFFEDIMLLRRKFGLRRTSRGDLFCSAGKLLVSRRNIVTFWKMVSILEILK